MVGGGSEPVADAMAFTVVSKDGTIRLNG